jgi:hypothetical protein
MSSDARSKLVFVLAMPRGDDRFSIDQLLRRRAQPATSAR